MSLNKVHETVEPQLSVRRLSELRIIRAIISHCIFEVLSKYRYRK